MSPKVKSLAARIGDHQKKFLGAGGKPRGLKYPVEWQLEAARLRNELKVPVADFARQLGVGPSALLRWCKQEVPSRAGTQLASALLPTLAGDPAALPQVIVDRLLEIADGPTPDLPASPALISDQNS